MTEKIFVIKDFENRPDDKRCLVGTRSELVKALSLAMECSLDAREIEKIPDDKTLYWVEFNKLNWAGCGGGSSELFTNLGQVQEWIIRKVKEWHVDIGEVTFTIYPVYRVIKKQKKPEGEE